MRTPAVLIAGLLLAAVAGCAGSDRSADLSGLAGTWVYEFPCVDPEGELYQPQLRVEIRPNGEIFDFIANEIVGDFRRGVWAVFEYQVTFRDAAYPTNLGDIEFGYDNVRFNLEPGGDLFIGRHVYSKTLGSLDWCACDRVRLYRLPEGAEIPEGLSPGVEERPLVCRNISRPSGGNLATHDPPPVARRRRGPAQ